MKKNTIFIILLAVLLVIGIIGFFYYRNTVFSKQILKLEILGPDSAKAGDEVAYTVKYKNNGNFVLENPKLIFELPENSPTEDSKTRFTENLKDIYPGQEDSIQFKGRLLGKEGDLKIASARLTYAPRNLSARYESETKLTTKIDSVPLTLTYDIASKIEKGKEINYSINYFSNINYPLENLSIKVEPVKGFEFKSSDPVSLDNSEWKIGTLNKGQGGRIKIGGIIAADAEDRVSFLAKLGMWQDGVFVVIKEASQEIGVIQPLLFISQQINGDINYAASPGETLNYQIFLRNIGSTPFDNLFLIIRLEGQAYDLSTLQSESGQARPSDSLVIFDSRRNFNLRHLAPKEETEVEFQVKLKNNIDFSNLKDSNLSVKNTVEVLDISQEFTTKISSKIDFWQRAYHRNINNIENFGAVPPKTGKDTSYAIVWEIKNYLNDLKNVKVKAVLPQNVSLVDNIFPESESSRLSFDSKSREIVWSAGSLPSGASATLTFQVVVAPTSFQIGKTASLIGQATVFAEDQFTNSAIQKTVPGINTILPDDRENSGGGIVQ